MVLIISTLTQHKGLICNQLHFLPNIYNYPASADTYTGQTHTNLVVFLCRLSFTSFSSIRTGDVFGYNLN